MLLAWSSRSLETCCLSGSRLRSVAGDRTEAAEDLLQLVAQAQKLGDLEPFRCVRLGVSDGNLTFAIDEVVMHAHALSADGTPRTIANRASLFDYASVEALLVLDLHVRGRSVMRRAS